MAYRETEYRLDEDQLDRLVREMLNPLYRMRGDMRGADLMNLRRQMNTYVDYIYEDLETDTIGEVAQALANIAERIRLEYDSLGVDVSDIDFPTEDDFAEAIDEIIDEAEEEATRSPTPPPVNRGTERLVVQLGMPQPEREWTPSDWVSQPLPDINYIAPDRYGDPTGYINTTRSRSSTMNTDPNAVWFEDEDPTGSGRRKSKHKVYKMPYKLRKVPKKDLYWVVNKETGKKHSKEGLPKEEAKAQMRALYANEKKGGSKLASNPAVNELYQKADTFTASIQADNALANAEEAQRATNKSAMEQALEQSKIESQLGKTGGSHKSQHIRYILGHMKEKNEGYVPPFNPFNPNLIKNKSEFIKGMVSSAKGKKGKKVSIAEKETSKVVAPSAPKDKFARARELKAEGMSGRKIAEQLKKEGFTKVSPSWVALALKKTGKGYDEHPEDFFF